MGGFLWIGGDCFFAIVEVLALIYSRASASSICRIRMAISLSSGSGVGIGCVGSISMSGWVLGGAVVPLLLTTSLPFLVACT